MAKSRVDRLGRVAKNYVTFNCVTVGLVGIEVSLVFSRFIKNQMCKFVFDDV